VDSGRFVVITGPNGGGKSTLAKMIAGIEKPTAGKILLDGTDMTDLSITDRAKLGVSYAFQQPVRFKGITVLDLLRIASGKRLSVSEACAILSEVGLCARDYVNREVNGSLSGGELKRIEIATVLTRGTQLSVFDEPEAGIDLWSFQNLISVFERMRQVRSDRTILVISHQERILNIADESLPRQPSVSHGSRRGNSADAAGHAVRRQRVRTIGKDHREGGPTADEREARLFSADFWKKWRICTACRRAHTTSARMGIWSSRTTTDGRTTRRLRTVP